MSTTFISDLHLSAKAPKITERFMDFAASITAPSSETKTLYILGDLFEYWIGDDAVAVVGMQGIIDALKKISDANIDAYFIRGNRDFLVTDSFAQQTGFKLLEDETVIDLYGEKNIILHGDSLCTDDQLHQQFRQQMMCNPEWHKLALSLTVEQRIAKAEELRGMSADHKSSISDSIMDVNDQAVVDLFEQHGVTRMIHGHTHRPNMHQHQTKNGESTRIVLGDWYTQSSVLTVTDDQQYSLSNLQ